MPLKKVYGKSRAIYDPFALFDSPQRRAPAVNIDASQLKSANLGSDETDQGLRTGRERNALGEVNLNTKLSALPPTSNKTKWRKQIVVEDSDDEDAAEQTVPTEERLHKQALAWENDYPESANELRDQKDAHHGERGPSTVLKEEQSSIPETADVLVPLSKLQPLEEYAEHCTKLLELSSHGMTEFQSWCNELSIHFNMVKIAEASYSEVYRLLPLVDVPGLSSNDVSVLKIIPLRPPASMLPTDKRKRAAALKKAENMSFPEHVANEVKLLNRMSNIPGFTNFRDVRIVQGRPPAPFQKAFKDFNASQKARGKATSLFPDPAKKTSYPDDQLWAVVEMQDAGVDLEQLVESEGCASIWNIWDAFWQVVLALAKGEDVAKFEHRDLHLGNICVRMPSDRDFVGDSKRKFGFTGLEITIIDYTLSRASMDDETIAYHDLARDGTLFEADSSEEYQYDIYRYMRGAVFSDNPFARFSGQQSVHQKRSWCQYHPVTNLIWLHYILYKLLAQVDWPSEMKAPPRKMKEEHAKWKRANDLEHVLMRVRDLLEPDRICESLLGAASDLVSLALTESWLDAEDVVGGETDQTDLVERFEALDVDVVDA